MDLIAKFRTSGISERVIKVFSEVDRSKFVLSEYKESAYVDCALPIGYGGTISQPSTVVLMLDALNVNVGDKVLEVGAGSGYNASLLSKLVGVSGSVFSVEIVPELYRFAKRNLKGFDNVHVILGDASKGLVGEAPFSKIILTAGCDSFNPR